VLMLTWLSGLTALGHALATERCSRRGFTLCLLGCLGVWPIGCYVFMFILFAIAYGLRRGFASGVPGAWPIIGCLIVLVVGWVAHRLRRGTTP